MSDLQRMREQESPGPVTTASPADLWASSLEPKSEKPRANMH